MGLDDLLRSFPAPLFSDTKLVMLGTAKSREEARNKLLISSS